MFIAGLTGNYGMGKSLVLSMFRELGAITIDADLVVKILLLEKETLKRIKALLGTGVFDKKGNLDKRKVAEKIFRNKNLRIKLENILHPLVFERIDNFIKVSKNNKNIFIIEAPLIFERGYENRFDRMITVFTDEKTAIKRLGLRSINKKMAMERLKCQLPIREKIKRADFSIDNSGTRAKTEKQVRAVYKKLLEDAKIKRLISEGKVKDAGKILGKHVSIEGKVIKGAGRGAKILNTPTANISIKKPIYLKEGVYAVRVAYSPIHRFTNSPIFDGVANIGKNPTFGDMPLSYEVHLFDFSGNLLGKKLRVEFISRIRDEKKFPNVKALEMQIKRDIKKAKEILRKT